MITTAILLSSIMEEWAEHCRMASIRPRLPQLELGLQAVLAVNIILIQVIIILQCTPCHVALLDILNPKEIGLLFIHFLGNNGTHPSTCHYDYKEVIWAMEFSDSLLIEYF